MKRQRGQKTTIRDLHDTEPHLKQRLRGASCRQIVVQYNLAQRQAQNTLQCKLLTLKDTAGPQLIKPVKDSAVYWNEKQKQIKNTQVIMDA